MNTERENDTVEIDIKALGFTLWKRKWWILLCGLLVAIIAFGYTSFFVKPVYRSTTRVYILNSSENEKVNSGDLQFASQITADYENLIKGINVTREAAEKLGMKSLPGSISVSSPEDTRILDITVSDTDPKRAKKVADMVRDVSSEQIISIMNIDAVNTVYEATMPTAPSAPNPKKNAMLGFVAGVAIMCILFVVVFLLDDTIKGQDDIEKYLGLSTLGIIPLDHNEKDRYANSNGSKRKRKNRK